MRILFLSLFLISTYLLHAQQPKPQDIAKIRDDHATLTARNGWWKEHMKNHDARIQWWREAKFGMFVHWGIYAVPGNDWNGKSLGGYSEHLMRREKIPTTKYLDIAKQFNPVKFNADEWIRDAKAAGMRYFVITAKHHDGFAMYPSAVSDFTIDKQTPFKRDPMAELAAACKKHGLKFGFYYSHAFDWEHPDAPGNDWQYKNPGGDDHLHGGRRWYDENPQMVAKAAKYVDEKAIPQILELIEKYNPDIFWFDTPHKLPYSENLRVLKAIWDKDKNIVVNGRITDSWPYGEWGDYKSTDDQPVEFFSHPGDWEAIPTTNDSYGYSRADKSHKPVSFFIRLMSKASARGGNLLMNLGPMGDGAIDDKDKEILSGIGKWMDVNGESIYGTKKAVLPLQSWGVSTAKDNRIYLHVFNWPKDGKLYVGGLESNIKKAYLLADSKKESLKVKRLSELDLTIRVPKNAPDTSATVIVLEIEDDISTDKTMFVATNSPTQILAYDAKLNGDGLRKESGQKDSYYVNQMTKLTQNLTWNFRTNKKATFKVYADYMADRNTEGIFSISVDGDVKENPISKVDNYYGKRFRKEITTITLKPGMHKIVLKPVTITGKELIKILELNLIPEY